MNKTKFKVGQKVKVSFKGKIMCGEIYGTGEGYILVDKETEIRPKGEKTLYAVEYKNVIEVIG